MCKLYVHCIVTVLVFLFTMQPNILWLFSFHFLDDTAMWQFMIRYSAMWAILYDCIVSALYMYLITMITSKIRWQYTLTNATNCNDRTTCVYNIHLSAKVSNLKYISYAFKCYMSVICLFTVRTAGEPTGCLQKREIP